MVQTSLATTLLCGAFALSCTGSDLDSSFADGAEFRFDNGVLRAEIPDLVFRSDRSVERTIVVDTALALRQTGEGDGEGDGESFIGELLLGTEHTLELAAAHHRQWRSGYATLDSTRVALRDSPDADAPPLRDRGLSDLEPDQVQRQSRPELPQGLEACRSPSLTLAVQLTSFDFSALGREAALLALSAPESEAALFRDPIEAPGALGTATLEHATGARIRAILECPAETLIADFSGLVR